MQSSSRQSYIMLISSMIIFGTIGIFRRYIPLSSGMIAFFRGVIGAFSLFLITLPRRKKTWQKISGRKFAGLLITGVLIGINWILLFEAFNYTTIAKATLCYYLQPTIVLLAAPFFLREKLTLKKILCAIAALIGMVLVSGVLRAGQAQSTDFQGVLFALGAACLYAAVIILNKKIADINIYQKTTIQLFFAGVVLLPYLLVTGDFQDLTLNATTIVLLLIVCIIHTGLAYALYFGSMTNLRAQTISLFSYIDPIVAMIASALLLKEGLTWEGILGAVLIIGSAVICEIEPRKKTGGEG